MHVHTRNGRLKAIFAAARVYLSAAASAGLSRAFEIAAISQAQERIHVIFKRVCLCRGNARTGMFEIVRLPSGERLAARGALKRSFWESVVVV